MALRCYKDQNLNRESMALVGRMRAVITRYASLGFRLTLRQLYYQLVAGNHVPNTEQSYKRVGRILSDARIGGLVDWDAIEDRVRVPNHSPEWNSVGELAQIAARQFRLPRRATQDVFVELWVEKDALANVLLPIARDFHVTLMVNRGYSSSSAMHAAAQRFIDADQDRRVLLYLGDLDPSGEDMVRDIADRLQLFEADVEVIKLGLTMAQVEEHHPPPNPAKRTDSRFANFAAEHGTSSWELDSLPPDVLGAIVRAGLEDHTDEDALAAEVAREEAQRAQLVTWARRHR